MQQKTETGSLPDGIWFEDQLHQDFEIGLPLMRHTGEALEAANDKFGSTDGFDADTFYRISLLASTLIRLGDIPAEKLNADLLYDNLTEGDFDVLSQAHAVMKAKRNGEKPGSSDSASPSSPSESTDSPKSE